MTRFSNVTQRREGQNSLRTENAKQETLINQRKLLMKPLVQPPFRTMGREKIISDKKLPKQISVDTMESRCPSHALGAVTNKQPLKRFLSVPEENISTESQIKNFNQRPFYSSVTRQGEPSRLEVMLISRSRLDNVEKSIALNNVAKKNISKRRVWDGVHSMAPKNPML